MMGVMAEPARIEDFLERRALERLPTTLRGKVFPGALDCIIADYNARGAKLQFDEPQTLPERIVLVVWSSGLAFEAQPRWRSASEVGVQFSSSCDFRGRVPARLSAIRALWRKRRPHIGRRQMLKTSAMIQKRSRNDPWMG
jgi:hypothetical protein